MSHLIGHQARFDALARAFAKNAVPQTLLLSGPLHIGKSTFIVRYAQLLLCPNVTSCSNGLPRGCGECRVCHQIEIETFPDYRVFRPVISASEPTAAPDSLDSSIFNVEMARNFIEESTRKPLVGPRKVMFVSQFDRANEAAQNAMLKTLEEPGQGIHLVLTTENSKKLRETIMSRCWHLQLSPAPDSQIESWLYEKFPAAAPNDVLGALAAAHGRPGAAFRELERLSSLESAQKTRFQIATEILERLEKSSPVGAFGLTEISLKWAKEWWEEDSDGADSKKLGAKGNRAAAARFLDELMGAVRAKWSHDLQNSEIGAKQIEIMRQTRGYILRNANLNLALDVMFGKLISLKLSHSYT
jgi:hypothetical protein